MALTPLPCEPLSEAVVMPAIAAPAYEQPEEFADFDILAQAAAISGVQLAIISGVHIPPCDAAVALVFEAFLPEAQQAADFASPALAAAAVVLSVPHANTVAEQSAVAATARVR